MRKAPLGKNEIRKSLSIKAKNAGLQLEGKRVTNHSARKPVFQGSSMQIFWKTLWSNLERVYKEPDFTILHAISKL